MRIACTVTRRETLFRFYRDDDRFHADLKPLIPTLLAGNGEPLIGEEDDPEGALLTEGPLTSNAEAELLRRAKRYLGRGCPPVPPPDGPRTEGR